MASQVFQIHAVRQLDKQQAYQKHLISLMRLSRLVQRTVPAKGDTFDQAIAIRNAIYHGVALKGAPKDFDFDDFGQAFVLSTQRADVGQICGGLTVLYMAALEARSIPARYVGLFTRSEEQDPAFANHATVEFYYNGRWFASDPTFNVMFTRNGRFLSYAELFEAIRAGKSYEVTSNGLPLIKGRSISQYSVPLHELMNFVVIDPSRAYSAKLHRSVQTETQFLPQTWNGALTQHGSSREQAGYGETNSPKSLYTFLESGPLR